jgi:dihydrofolate reductase
VRSAFRDSGAVRPRVARWDEYRGARAAALQGLAQHGGDGHIVVWGGVSLCRSLMRLDLIDELQVSLFPYVAGEGTRLFDGGPDSYQLDLVSSTASNNGIVELQYRRTYPPFRVAGLSAFMHHVFRSGH